MRKHTAQTFIALAALLALTGCPSEPPVTSTGNNQATNNTSANNTSANNSTGNNTSTNATTQPDNPGHGEDDDAETFPVGFLNGSWRLATDDADDAPVAYLDLVHDEGQTTATGTFLMSIGMGPGFDGKTGELTSVTWQGEVLTATFNPTADREEVWTLTSTQKIDDDKLKGSISNKRGDITQAVVIERQLPDPSDDGVRIDDGTMGN